MSGSALIAVTQGDPSGVGPEIVLKAWRAREASSSRFFVIADPMHLRRCAEGLGFSDTPIEAVAPENAAEAFAHALPVVDVGAAVRGVPGSPDASDAGPTIAAIEMAVELVCTGKATAITTNPITKASLYRAGFAHPGHTEFLGELADRHCGGKATPVMMLWSPELAVVPVTIHVPLAKAISMLTRDLIVETGLIVDRWMRSQFGVDRPRLAFSGLNPHAGEQGAMGQEDAAIIAPAITELCARGIVARGPLPGDTMFHPAAREAYDVAVCMYHDQALIPIKTIAFDEAVNVTLGLPFVRTSPDHGTAYDIAGKGLARPDSLIAAIRLAARLGKRATATQAART